MDSVNIFKLLDEIISQRRNNYVKEFEKFDDISSWLKDQWAGLFADLLSRTSREASLRDLESQLSELGNVTTVLKGYTESIMRKVQPEESKVLILKEERRLKIKKMESLLEEDLISFILNNYNPKPNNIYRAMERNDKLEGFLKMAGLNIDEIKEFMSEHGKIGRKDFKNLKTKYFGSGELVMFQEEMEKDD